MESLPLQALILKSSELEVKISELGGKLTPEIEAELDALSQELMAKVDSYDFIMSALKSKSDMFGTQAQFFENVSASLAAARERMKQYAKMAMIQGGTKEILGDFKRFALTQLKPSLVVDESRLPEKYFIQVITTQIDKEFLRADLERGIEVEGAKLVENYRFNTYANKGVK